MSESSDDQPEGKPPLLQRVLDNPWLLLALGIAITAVSYTLWGWVELTSAGPARLP